MRQLVAARSGSCALDLPPGNPVTTARSADAQEDVMQICERISHQKFSGADLAEYLHEDLAQTLCAVKFHLELFSQSESHGGELASSIGALQGAIRQLSALAVENRPAPAGTYARGMARSRLAPEAAPG
jgi:signal transduction histidine kinase